MIKSFILTLLLLFTTVSNLFATEEVYPFNHTQDKVRFQELTIQLRCLVCQNQNLAESNAPLAVDLRNQIYTKIKTGQSNSEILNYLSSRYGDFVFYSPPFNPLTFGLWLGPFLILIVGIIYLLMYLKNKKSK